MGSDVPYRSSAASYLLQKSVIHERSHSRMASKVVGRYLPFAIPASHISSIPDGRSASADPSLLPPAPWLLWGAECRSAPVYDGLRRAGMFRPRRGCAWSLWMAGRVWAPSFRSAHPASPLFSPPSPRGRTCVPLAASISLGCWGRGHHWMPLWSTLFLIFPISITCRHDVTQGKQMAVGPAGKW